MTTEERLEKLEQEIAELRKCIRTKQLIVEDDKGQTRIELEVSNYGPRLELSDEGGKPRAVMGVVKHGPWLYLADENGLLRVQLSLYEKDGPRAKLGNENGEIIWKAP
jgi:hypothetical protein